MGALGAALCVHVVRKEMHKREDIPIAVSHLSIINGSHHESGRYLLMGSDRRELRGVAG